MTPTDREEWRAFVMAAAVVVTLTAAAWCSLGGCGSRVTMTGAGPALVVPIGRPPAWHGESDGGPP